MQGQCIDLPQDSVSWLYAVAGQRPIKSLILFDVYAFYWWNDYNVPPSVLHFYPDVLYFFAAVEGFGGDRADVDFDEGKISALRSSGSSSSGDVKDSGSVSDSAGMGQRRPDLQGADVSV